MLATLKKFSLTQLSKLTLVLFVLQPITDVASYWFSHFGISNVPTLIFRLLLLSATFSLGFLLSTNKRAYFVFVAIALAIAAGHIYAAFSVGYSDFVSDMTNYVRVLLTPVTALAMISFLKTEKGAEVYDSILLGATLNLFIIAAVSLIATVTGTDPHTYAETGVIGWFSNTNSQSAVLTAVSPVALAFTYKKYDISHPIFLLTLATSSLLLYTFGTRLAYAGIVVTIFGIAVSLLIASPKKRRAAGIIFALGAVVLLCVPFSPMAKHQKNYRDVQSERQESVEISAEESLLQSKSELTDDEKAHLISALAPIYEKYASDFVEIFGLERTAEIFDYSSDIAKITSTRQKKLLFAELLMEDSPVLCRIFGIELARFTVGDNNYDVENDFHGIYYLYGIVGVGAMLIFIGYFVFVMLSAPASKESRLTVFRYTKTLDAPAWAISLIMLLAHAVFTAGVLRRPSASFYLAVSLAAVYYLLKIKPRTEGKK